MSDEHGVLMAGSGWTQCRGRWRIECNSGVERGTGRGIDFEQMVGSRAAGKRRLGRVVQRGRRSDLFPKVSRGSRKESQRAGCAHTSRGRRGAVKRVQQRAGLKTALQTGDEGTVAAVDGRPR
jgi:hypothetical protein